jgi:hypothetical protein
MCVLVCLFVGCSLFMLFALFASDVHRIVVQYLVHVPCTYEYACKKRIPPLDKFRSFPSFPFIVKHPETSCTSTVRYCSRYLQNLGSS